ncbi:putative RNA polymerase II nuclear localization protein SLC7A6OS [Trichonephila clavata]|uniref:Probable RNA polymerase II nuclear localization protein SLC7A6OS n=1 Tax=Trichonephila clavata TaxID=2740835 RepID=A0A8X6GG61_TRICU|nr:putative RNA polymerase II nuclear localization protein SLC7A6OS [Trichonephila clavata]
MNWNCLLNQLKLSESPVTESVKDHIQAVLSKEKVQKFSKWRDPKSAVADQKSVRNIVMKFKSECKAASEKKKLDLLNNRRLILSETVPIEEVKNSSPENAEVRKLFHLYDILEESEDFKKQGEEVESTITCNDEPLIREKSGDYVYDVYISDVQIDCSFVDNPVSVRPCTMTQDDIYSSDSDDEVHEDEDDSNDENNWRNEYPEDESSDSHSENGSEDYDSEEFDPYGCNEVRNLRIGSEDYESEEFDPYGCNEVRNFRIENDDEEIYEYDSEEDDDYNESSVLMDLNDSQEST